MLEQEEKSIHQSLGVANSFKFLSPQKIVDQIEVNPGMKIAHFGCSTGYFTFLLAQRVGGSGQVYALDIISSKLEILKSQIKLQGIRNIAIKRVSLENKNGSGLENESMDWVIMVNMLYQNNQKNKIIKEAERVLKPGGKILLIDWETGDDRIGPKKLSRISKGDLIKIVRRYSLGIKKEIEVGNFHFGLILAK